MIRKESVRLDVSRKLPEPCLRYRQYDTGTQVVAYIERDGVPMSLDGLRCRLVAQTPRGTVWADMETDECSAAYTLTTALTGSVGIVHPYVEVLGADGSVVAATGAFAVTIDKAGYTAPADLPTDQSVLDQVGALARTAGDAAQAAKASAGAAAGSAKQAAAAQAAAESARDAAETAKAASATSAGQSSESAAGAAESAASAAGDSAQAAASAAEASKDAAAAAASATEAASSASAASASASAASGSAERAASSQGAAKASETAAESAQAAAESASTAAGKSAGSAASAAKAAESSSDKAATAAGEASESAKAAGAYANDAKVSAEAADGSASSAAESVEIIRTLDEQYRSSEAARVEAEDLRATAEMKREKAEEAREAETVKSASAVTLDAGAEATATKEGAVLKLGIPRGAVPVISLEATVDDTTGTPQVEVTRGGTDERPEFGLSFSGLKAVGWAQPMPEFDASTGRYTNESIKAYFDSQRDGLMHLQKIPKGAATAVETDGWFPLHRLVCGGADPDGSPWVESMADIDPDFREDDNGAGNNVWQAVQVVWERWDFDSDPDYVLHYMRDMPTKGMEPNPCAYLPDGTLRPYMLTAKYPLSVDADGRPRSVRGGKIKNRTISHDSLVDLCGCSTSGYSGPSTYDVWYRYTASFAHGTKDSQAIGAGCTSYSWQYPPSVAETGTTRVVLTASQAASVLVGSNVSLGSKADGHTDRYYADTYDVFDMRLVTSKEALADGSVAVVVDGEPFDTAPTQLLSSMPWDGGHAREGDKSGKYPDLLEGVELMHGGYEVMGTVVYQSDGDGWYAVVNPDSRNENKNALAEGAVRTSLRHTADSKWPITVGFEAGLVAPIGEGGSSSTGMGDINYCSADDATGIREDLHFGSLRSGSGGGLSSRDGWSRSGSAYWTLVSRLSATGRSMGVKAT